MYEYFISYNIKTKYEGYDRCGVGNVNFVLKRKITDIDDIREIEIRLKEKEKAENVVILNYQLMREVK